MRLRIDAKPRRSLQRECRGHFESIQPGGLRAVLSFHPAEDCVVPRHARSILGPHQFEGDAVERLGVSCRPGKQRERLLDDPDRRRNIAVEATLAQPGQRRHVRPGIAIHEDLELFVHHLGFGERGFGRVERLLHVRGRQHSFGPGRRFHGGHPLRDRRGADGRRGAADDNRPDDEQSHANHDSSFTSGDSM
jgi:hypothetical protein